jgi:hypothetical protein
VFGALELVARGLIDGDRAGAVVGSGCCPPWSRRVSGCMGRASEGGPRVARTVAANLDDGRMEQYNGSGKPMTAQARLSDLLASVMTDEVAAGRTGWGRGGGGNSAGDPACWPGAAGAGRGPLRSSSGHCSPRPAPARARRPSGRRTPGRASRRARRARSRRSPSPRPRLGERGDPPPLHLRGRGSAPPLAWSGAPAETRSFALVIEDPDAPDREHPQTTWVHWVVVDLPPETSSLPRAARCPRARASGRTTGRRRRMQGHVLPSGGTGTSIASSRSTHPSASPRRLAPSSSGRWISTSWRAVR